MKTLVIRVCILLTLYNVVYGEQYAGKLDNIDVDALLSNDRLLQNYAKCLLDKGPCTSEGQDLKEHIRGALESDCARCTPKQKENLRKAIANLGKNKPDMWKELVTKYDSSGAFRKKYADFLKESGVSSD